MNKIIIYTISIGYLYIIISGLAWSFNQEELKQLKETNVCRNCNLMNVNLSSWDLKQADLTGSDLRWAKLNNINLKEANLSNVNLSGAKLHQVRLSNTNLNGAIWLDGVKCAPGSIGKCKKD